ncbi:MAG TPA: hypothetical protein VM597_28910, partial [Gemmataceae bacterium]|nr:hypothetical protein [Gemmataceae bacterium]
MPSETRLDDLLRRWEDGQRRGNPVAPEDLCRDCPELLDPLRLAIAQLRHVNQVMGTLGPPGDTEPPPTGHPQSGEAHAGAPQVPAPVSREPSMLPEVHLRPGAEPV